MVSVTVFSLPLDANNKAVKYLFEPLFNIFITESIMSVCHASII